VKKNYCWIWIAVDRLKKKFISFVCGTRQIGMKLYKGFRKIKVECYCSYYWKSYKEILASEKHIQSKAQTYTVEGYNSKALSFKRKTKCYSKSKEMLEKSLKLLMLKLNN